MSEIGPRRDAGQRDGRRARARVAVASGLVVGLIAAGAQSASAAPGWLGAMQASGATDCAFLTQSSTIVSAPDATAVAAWQRRDDGCLGATRVEVAVRPPGGGFGDPVVLSDPTLEASDPKLAVDATGTVIAVWAENGAIRYSQRAPGGLFSPAQTIAGAGPLASAPDVAIAGGAAVAAWASAGATEVALKAPGSSTFGAVTQFATPVGEAAQDVDVAMNEAGAALLAWQMTGTALGGLDTLHAAARPTGGSFTELASVFTTLADADHIEAPQVQIDPAGRATLLWSYFDSAASIHVVKSAARGAGGSFGGVEDISDPAVDSGALGSIDLAVDGDNTAIAVWWALTMQASVRPPGGSFGPVIKSVSPQNFVITAPSVGFDPSGRAIAVWLSPGGTAFAVQSAILQKGAASFDAVVDAESIPAGAGDRLDGPTPIAIDDQGDAVTMWNRKFDVTPTTAAHRIESAWLDVVAPALTSVSIPSSGIAGTPVRVSATATDRLSPVTFAWSFGDRGTASGGSATHTYAAGGSYAVTVTASDAAGNASTASATIVIAPAPAAAPGAGAGGAGSGAPEITRLRLSRSSFRAARSGPTVKPASASLHSRTRVSYTLSADAKVRFTFEKQRLGRRSGSRCAKPARGNRGHKSCVRHLPVRGRFTRTRTRGGDRFTFTGRLLGHRLKAGRYRLVARATAGGRSGVARHATFRIRG